MQRLTVAHKWKARIQKEKKKKKEKKYVNNDLLGDPTNELYDRMILLSPRRRSFKLDDILSGLF